jgi:hypothetical protein
VKALLPFVALVLAACSEGDTVLGDATDAAAAPFPLYTAAQVAAAQVACQAIPGTVVSLSSTSQVKSLLVGSWISCFGPTDQLDAGQYAQITNVDGAQFTENDEFRNLVLDPSGNLTSGVSPVELNDNAMLIPSSTIDGGDDGARISYSIEPLTSEDDGESSQVDITYAAANSGMQVIFEDSPRRFVDGVTGFTYVYIGP